jgi:hypothetical protein
MDKEQNQLLQSMQQKYSENRITEDDKQILRETFKDNLPLAKLMRKIFLPELNPDNPLHMNIDLYMQADYTNMTPEKTKIAVLSRKELIEHVDACLFTILTLCETGELSPLQLDQKRKKDSNK